MEKKKFDLRESHLNDNEKKRLNRNQTEDNGRRSNKCYGSQLEQEIPNSITK